MNQKPNQSQSHTHQTAYSNDPQKQAQSPVKLYRRDVGLILAIIFASAAVSGSLVYFGMQLGGKGVDVSVDKIEQAFEGFVKKQQDKQVQDQQQAQQKQDQQADVMAKNVKPVDKTKDHIRGNVDAPISLIEYSDFECPYCKLFDPTAKKIIDTYAGKVNWVYRYNPLSFHDPMATTEAEATECASALGGNDKFWVFADTIYQRTTSNGNGLSVDDLYKIANDVGLDQVKFKACLDSNKYLQVVKDDLAQGAAAGINGTPGNILINNATGETKAVSGARDFSVFQQAIDAMLKK